VLYVVVLKLFLGLLGQTLYLRLQQLTLQGDFMSNEHNDLKLEIISTARELGVIKAALLYGKHRNTISSWLKAYEQGGESALTDKRGGGLQSEKMPPPVVKAILHLKQKNPALSAAKIKTALKLKYSISSINNKIRETLSPDLTRDQNREQKRYSFRLYTRKINLVSTPSAKYAVVLELDQPALTFIMLVPEKSQFESAAFCNRLFTAFKSVPGNDKAKICLLSENKQADSAQKALAQVYRRHQVVQLPDTSPREDYFSRDIVKTFRELPAGSECCDRLQAALIAHNFAQLAPAGGSHSLLTQFILKNQLLCRSGVLGNGETGEVENRLGILASLQLLKGFARQAAVAGEDQKAERLHHIIFELLEICPDHQLQTALWQQVGALRQRQGRFDQAAEAFRAAIATAQKAKNPAGVLRSRSCLGSLMITTGKIRQAAKFYRQQITLAHKLNLLEDEQFAYQALAVILQEKGNYTLAISYYNRVLELVETTGLVMHKAVALGSLADLYRRKGHFIKAKEYIEEAIFLAERENNHKQLAIFANKLGAIYENLGQTAKALEQHQKVLLISQQIKNPNLIALSYGNIGQINLILGNYAMARGYTKKFLKTIQQTGEKERQSIGWGNLGCVYKATRSYTRSENCFKKAIELGEALECNYFLCSFYYYLADQYYLQKKYVKAQNMAAKACKLAVDVERKGIAFAAGLLLTKTAYRLSYDKVSACRVLVADLSGRLKAERKTEYKAEIYYSLFTVLAEQSDLDSPEELFKSECRSQAVTLFKKLYKKSSNIDCLNKAEELTG